MIYDIMGIYFFIFLYGHPSWSGLCNAFFKIQDDGHTFCPVWKLNINLGGFPYITNGDSRRNVQKKPLTILGVAQANFIP